MMRRIYFLLLILTILASACNRIEATSAEDVNSQLFTSLATSLYHNSFAIDSTGALWGTGRNQYCELADAIAVCENDVNRYVKTTLTGAKQVTNGNFHTVVLMNDGTIRVAGDRTRGQIGISTGPTEVNNFVVPEFEAEVPTKIEKIAAGHYGTYLLDTDGGLWGTGYYFNGQLTYNDAPTFNAFKSKFIKVPTPDGVKFKDISYGYDQVLAIDTDGNIWATGGNRFGQLGIGADVNFDIFGFTKFVPSTPTRFVAVSAGGAGSGNGTDAFNGRRHTLALDEDGDIWVTGNNDFGQLGTGDYISVNTFKKITKPAGVNRFVKISAGGMTSIALSDSGDAYVTGNNIDYALGISESELINEFTKVPRPETVEQFIDIASGARHTQILDNKGKIWTAGANEYGQLGLGLEISLNSVAKTFTASNQKTDMLPTTPVQNPIVDITPPITDDTIKIGFVGNSLVFTNDVPLRLKEIATANGRKVDVKYQAISGDNLKNQFIYRDWAAHRIIAYYKPKYVFFQEQTSGTELNQVGWWKAFAASYGMEPILYQAWYNTNGCISSDTNSDKLSIKVAPVGYAFHQGVRGTWKCVNNYGGLTQQNAMNQDIKYTKPNDYHPNMKGAYLSALTLYATVFGITSGTIIKPDVLNTQAISDAEWTEMVTLAIGAINNNKDASSNLRALRPYTDSTVNNTPMQLSTTAQDKTITFPGYIAHNIPFTIPSGGGELDIKLTTDDAGSFYWFLRESNGRLIGKSAPSIPWPNRVTGDCLNANTLDFNSNYVCLENKSLADVFFGYGDRIVGGIPYEDKKLPAGDYVLIMIPAKNDPATTTLSIRIK